MKRKRFAYLMLTFLTIIVLRPTQSYATCHACSLDVSFPPVSLIYPMFEYNSGMDEYCTIDIHTTLKRYKCDDSTYYDEYEITKIEVYGYCTLSSTEIMRMAVKGIAALKNRYNQPVNYIRIPKCLYKSSTSPDVYESCDSDPCCIYFESHWDSTNADYYLDSISIEIDTTDCSGIYPSCHAYCNESILPETGRLNISANMPPPCFSSCSRYDSWPQPYIQHYFMDSTYFNGLYTLGSSGSTPCFSFNVFQVKYNYMAPENAIEKLIKIALHQIYHTQGQPQYITLNLWKCWQAPYSPQQTYFPCTNSDCCEITFEMLYNGTQAQVYSRNTPNEECQGTCVEVCDILDNNPFMLPKSTAEIDELDSGETIKINPNPNTGFFELEYWTSLSEVHTIRVVDMLGNIIFSTTHQSRTGNNNLQINLTKAPVGAYYLHIFSKGLTLYKIKFIKN